MYSVVSGNNGHRCPKAGIRKCTGFLAKSLIGLEDIVRPNVKAGVLPEEAI